LGFVRPLPPEQHRAHRIARSRVRFRLRLRHDRQHLSRWAEQWIIYMTTEFGFIKIADRYTTSSR
jgi:argininosuccinate lyase